MQEARLQNLKELLLGCMLVPQGDARQDREMTWRVGTSQCSYHLSLVVEDVNVKMRMLQGCLGIPGLSKDLPVSERLDVSHLLLQSEVMYGKAHLTKLTVSLLPIGDPSSCEEAAF